MRITAGSALGRTLHVPQNQSVRPTRGRVRQALFSMLGQDLSGHTVLDAFAGSGALGVEALSRGADRAYFVEPNTAVLTILRDNVRLFASQSEVIPTTLQVMLLNPSHLPAFSLVFLDPPFGANLWQQAAVWLQQAGCLTTTVSLVCEFPTQKPLEFPFPWHCFKLNRYGHTSIGIWQRRDKA